VPESKRSIYTQLHVQTVHVHKQDALHAAHAPHPSQHVSNTILLKKTWKKKSFPARKSFQGYDNIPPRKKKKKKKRFVTSSRACPVPLQCVCVCACHYSVCVCVCVCVCAKTSREKVYTKCIPSEYHHEICHY
jgi:hypothetical protein